MAGQTVELPKKPKFERLKPQDVSSVAEVRFRCVDIPPNRYTPLYKAWKTHFYEPIRNEMKIDIRTNLKTEHPRVELKTMPDTPDIGNLQKCAEYLNAFMLGFDPDQVKDAFLKYDGFYLDTVNIKEVKSSLKGEHLSRTIGRICGKGGKTKFTIENATKTRIVVAGEIVHVCGSYAAVKIARDAICRLILGSPAGSVYSRLRIVASRASESINATDYALLCHGYLDMITMEYSIQELFQCSSFLHISSINKSPRLYEGVSVATYVALSTRH
ncbi:hypothetical protein Cgig2_023878 [Carnegiea gigantea]|uniref:K Homology domain-containing protein n=1 Tax=Carnegiea gigantea TaxID=171969 RepID=A0A9Q1GK61_9CARY|nr:hypothetical protein Cgig2_023878 [Carnegiea gigantea]